MYIKKKAFEVTTIVKILLFLCFLMGLLPLKMAEIILPEGLCFKKFFVNLL